MHGDLGRKPVTRRERRPQGILSMMAVVEVKLLGDRLERDVGFLDGVIQDGDVDSLII